MSITTNNWGTLRQHQQQILHANNSILFDYIYVRSKDKSLGKNKWFIDGCTCTSNENRKGE
jgi:hypothetical protein